MEAEANFIFITILSLMGLFFGVAAAVGDFIESKIKKGAANE